MTPLQIVMMLHYYAIAEPYAMRQPEHATSPAVKEQRMALLHSDMLELDNSPSGYAVTPRGLAYIEALLEVPLPIKKEIWVIPDKE